jgi:Ca2+-binding RTX toxin-like protein
MAIKTYVTGNSTLTVSDNDTTVVGDAAANGTQTIKIASGVTGVTTDSNIDRVDVAGNLADFRFVTTAAGTQIQNAAGTVVATIPSLNGTTAAPGTAVVAFADGSANLVQSATGFALGGQAIGSTAAAISSTTLGTNFNTAVKSTVTTTTTTTTLPTLSIAAATVTEGNSGTVNLVFNVSLSAASTTPVTVAYAATGVSAVSGADFTATSGTLTIPANTTTTTINVPVLGDTVFEANETLTVTLSNPSANATVSTTAGSATGTITNDDTNALPVITVPTTTPSAFIGNSTALTGISFTDADDNAGFTVTLQAAGNSQLSFTALTGVAAKNAAGTVVNANESSNLITLSGTKSDVNTALTQLKYSTNSTIPTTESVTVKVVDPNGGTANSTVSVNIGSSLTLTAATTDSLVGSAGDDLISGTLANLATTDTISAGTGTDKLTLTAVNGAVAGVISGVDVLDLTLTGASTVTVTTANFGSVLKTVNTSGAQTLGGTFNSGTTFNFDATTNAGFTVTNLLDSAGSASAVTTDAITLNFNGSSTVASIVTAVTDTATTIDTLNVVSSGTFTTANSITTLNGLATNATVNVSGTQAFTVTNVLPNLGTGKFDATNASGKITVTAGNFATTIIGGSGADAITGGTSSTSLTGGAGNDTIVGGVAADTITGGLGADSITGGATGVNTYVFAAGDSPATGRDTLVDLREGDIIKFGTALTGLTNGAALTTSTANAIHVDTTNNRLVVGSDQISIPSAVANAAFTYSYGTDSVVGTADDTLTVGAAPLTSVNDGLGTLTLAGKAISTAAIVTSATVPPTVNTASIGSNQVTKVVASNVTNSGITVTGSAVAESVTGSPQADTITAGAGADTLLGGLGDDVITGDAGIDSITGGTGADYIVLNAFNSADVLTDFATASDRLYLDINKKALATAKATKTLNGFGTKPWKGATTLKVLKATATGAKKIAGTKHVTVKAGAKASTAAAAITKAANFTKQELFLASKLSKLKTVVVPKSGKLTTKKATGLLAFGRTTASNKLYAFIMKDSKTSKTSGVAISKTVTIATVGSTFVGTDLYLI